MSPEADWIAALRAECTPTPERPDRSQSVVGRELGISNSTICSVLKGKYKASTKRIEELVRGRYMAATVECPQLSTIPLDKCVWWQAQPYMGHNPLRPRMYRACRSGCPHSKLKKQYEP